MEEAIACICDFPDTCGGLGSLSCGGGGGDLCVCECGGEIGCLGCNECEDDDWADEDE